MFNQDSDLTSQIFMIITSLLSFFIFIFILIQSTLTSNSPISDPQLSPIESGFESLKQSSYLSSSFFLLAVLFVLFDMELILLLVLLYFAYQSSFSWMISSIFILFFISISLMVEWLNQGLKWSS